MPGAKRRHCAPDERISLWRTFAEMLGEKEERFEESSRGIAGCATTIKRLDHDIRAMDMMIK
jgi:heme oxygenase